MGLKGKTMTNAGLQIRMTAFVTAAVLLVVSVALLVIASGVRKGTEEMVDERLADDLSAIARVMEQRLLMVEGSTRAMAAWASRALDNGESMDSVLCRSLEAGGSAMGMSLIFNRERFPKINGYYERYAYFDDNGKIQLESYVNGDELDEDPDWVQCYKEGKQRWGDIGEDYLSNHDEICFFVPLLGKNGEPVGIAYSALQTRYLTSFVKEYKGRKDIDISIYKSSGAMVVAPDDYILELSPDDLIVRETIINYIGWKVILSADRDIVERDVREATLTMLFIFALMFIVIFLAIRFTVRFVATPFIQEQKRTEAEKAVMENEMALASKAQNELVPNVFPPFPDRKGIDLSACLHPARSVGGDLYDYFLCGDKLYFCIGDVSGKGMQAALFMSAAHYLFRNVASRKSATDAANQMNLSLCADNTQCRFVTFWMGCLNLVSGDLKYVNAGHDSPVLVRDGKVETLPASENMPLGVMEEAEFISGALTLQPGDTILLYTDGVTEAMNAEGNTFGRERLLNGVMAAAGSDAGCLVANVLESVRNYTDGADQSDDITMLCLKFIEKETKIIS